MTVINYPALFHKSEAGYWVKFPDLPGCLSEGNTLEEAYVNAREAVGLYLDTGGDLFERKFNPPSSFEDVLKEHEGQIIMLVEFDSLEYARRYKNKAVKKTLTIPEWLNEAAMKKGINFSQVLQNALIAMIE
ncbi:MAG: type II toxin-antitoxin system HicB family antitoxin [Erysipelotrichaceae bacterium]|nr:type II toxin-antitoxin system HicB family antitoxin [Erysipelotrichaceae bacterium]